MGQTSFALLELRRVCRSRIHLVSQFATFRCHTLFFKNFRGTFENHSGRTIALKLVAHCGLFCHGLAKLSLFVPRKRYFSAERIPGTGSRACGKSRYCFDFRLSVVFPPHSSSSPPPPPFLLLSSTLCTRLGSSNCTAASSSNPLRKTFLPPSPRPYPKSEFFRRGKERRYFVERRGIFKTTTSSVRGDSGAEKRTSGRALSGSERSNAIR